jgi:transposase
VIAPLVLDGPMTGAAFRAETEQVRAQALAPGDVLVMDNLAAHEFDGVQQAIAGASILYLPPYSPDLNPIEMLFAKLSRPCSERLQHERRTRSGRSQPACSPPSRLTNAPTTSPAQGMELPEWNVRQSRPTSRAADRISCSKAPASQFRLLVHTAAYRLLHPAPPRPQGPVLAHAHFDLRVARGFQ